MFIHLNQFGLLSAPPFPNTCKFRKISSAALFHAKPPTKTASSKTKSTRAAAHTRRVFSWLIIADSQTHPSWPKRRPNFLHLCPSPWAGCPRGRSSSAAKLDCANRYRSRCAVFGLVTPIISRHRLAQIRSISQVSLLFQPSRVCLYEKRWVRVELR